MSQQSNRQSSKWLRNQEIYRINNHTDKKNPPKTDIKPAPGIMKPSRVTRVIQYHVGSKIFLG